MGRRCDLGQLCKADVFLANCWRTLPDLLPATPPPQCFVCGQHQVLAVRIPTLEQGVRAFPPCYLTRTSGFHILLVGVPLAFNISLEGSRLQHW